jgi:hypothetical protein
MVMIWSGSKSDKQNLIKTYSRILGDYPDDIGVIA